MGANDGRDLLSDPYPGADTRSWGAWGVVDADPSDAAKASIRFLAEDGTPLPDGYLVDVTLGTSGINVQCRVVGPIAGQGEASFEPFNPGDLVYVMIPEGDERAGCAIVGRANNELDSFPLVVSGFDVTQNNFGFIRLRVPRVIETASGYLIRSSVTGAHIGIDQSGGVTIGAGDGGYLHLGPDFLGLQTQDSAGSIQVVPALGSQGNQVQANADACSLTLDQDQCLWVTPGTICIGGAGVIPGGHALTLEQFLTIMQNFVIPPTVGMTGPIMWAALAAAVTAGNGAPLDPTVITPAVEAIFAGAAAPPFPLAGVHGVGCPGVLLG